MFAVGESEDDIETMIVNIYLDNGVVAVSSRC